MKILLPLLLLFLCLKGIAQDYTSAAHSFLKQNEKTYNFDNQDIASLKTSSSSFSSSLNAQTVYISQYYRGVEILNSSSLFLIRENEVLHAALSFEKGLSTRVNSTNASLTAATAINYALNFKDISITGPLQVVESQIDGAFQYKNESVSVKPMTVKPVYVAVGEEFILSWEVYIETIDNQHMYLLYVNALTGALIKEQDLVINCTFSSHSEPNHVHSNSKSYSFQKAASVSTAMFMDNSKYNVYALPLESPNHGNETLVNSPANVTASPNGWHDTDGMAGPEFTITRGNNVYAQEDFDGDGNTLGAAPDGNLVLNFNFPQQLDVPARDNINGSTINLFYMNNMMHDIWYSYGFDEASGNFQSNNYGNGGLENDFVVADAQDGSGFNNASFGTPADGGNPRMNMFLWNAPTTGGVDPITLNNGNLAGTYSGVTAGFGPSFPNPSSAINADLALVIDNNSGGVSTDANDACDVITNGASLSGKIAVMNRGNCQFGTKVLAAENQGAIAVIVINNAATAPFTMGAGNDGGAVTIPSIMISQADGNLLLAELQNGAVINANLNNTGLFRKDGSLDNGIVSHEYGHGISTRLTGGPANPGCLGSIEQMGEGWSDWFSLIITIEPGDAGTDTRGIGTFAINQPITGGGIRNFPYSTDMSVNPVTFADTNNTNFSVPHGMGSIWASMLWDLSWRFIDDFGFDPDLYNGTGGNNIAMQLIMDGMKLQPCNPGFQDGRDAILQADAIANGGANRDRIWEVFANRGLGFSASSGDVNNRFDQVEAFDTPPPLNISSENATVFNISPNPSDGIISISTTNTIKNGIITVYDFNGRSVFTKNAEFDSIEKLNLGTLNSGIYLISIKGDDVNHVAKVIIN
ncbi:MAG: T9SS-dependent M36 family metallopeptidase [Nonlabens sp.]|uniref:T9SS-dependent M36 family metallopeptidase n=1 Tax=Nonlabens sp. TaxID=1888209 RepID=UPI003EF0B13F